MTLKFRDFLSFKKIKNFMKIAINYKLGVSWLDREFYEDFFNPKNLLMQHDTAIILIYAKYTNERVSYGSKKQL